VVVINDNLWWVVTKWGENKIVTDREENERKRRRKEGRKDGEKTKYV
jgi:hypothetical protein